MAFRPIIIDAVSPCNCLLPGNRVLPYEGAEVCSSCPMLCRTFPARAQLAPPPRRGMCVFLTFRRPGGHSLKIFFQRGAGASSHPVEFGPDSLYTVRIPLGHETYQVKGIPLSSHHIFTGWRHRICDQPTMSITILIIITKYVLPLVLLSTCAHDKEAYIEVGHIGNLSRAT